MQYRTLAGTGVEVSTQCLGAMMFGAFGNRDHDDCIAIINRALDGGINFIDTADMYSHGESEEIVGKAIATRRDQVVLATKLFNQMDKDDRNARGASRHWIMREVENSLRRLGTDHIDLYQVHEWDGLTPLEETLSALDALVGSGKVRYVGSSNYTARQLMKSLWISDRDGLESFVSEQIYYSLQARDAENELIPIAVDEGLGVLVWSPLAGGLLSGKYRRGQKAPKGSRRFEGWSEPPVHDEDRLYDTIDALVELGERHGVSAAQVALAYTLAKPAVTSVIVGARTEEQLADNLAAAELRLSDDELRRLDDVSAVPLLYPYWHQANTAVGRLNPADLSLLGRHVSA